MTIRDSNSKIIQLLGAGKVYKEIAAEMGMKVCTVRERVRDMKKNEHCKTITQLVVKLLKVPKMVS